MASASMVARNVYGDFVAARATRVGRENSALLAKALLWWIAVE